MPRAIAAHRASTSVFAQAWHDAACWYAHSISMASLGLEIAMRHDAMPVGSFAECISARLPVKSRGHVNLDA